MSSNITKSDVPMGSTHATAMTTEKKNSGLAIASLVCGIVGFFFFGIVLGVLAIIFGAIAMNKIKEKPNELQGMCMAKGGLICGIIVIILWAIIIAIWASA